MLCVAPHVSILARRILRVCFKKCITPKVKLGELEIGELTCIDRCVPKYVQAHELAQEEFRRLLPQQSGDAAGQ